MKKALDELLFMIDTAYEEIGIVFSLKRNESDQNDCDYKLIYIGKNGEAYDVEGESLYDLSGYITGYISAVKEIG